MTNEKKIWLCEQYAQRMWTLALALAQGAANAGQQGREFATAAEEARNLSHKLFLYTKEAKFDGADDNEFRVIADCAVMAGFLAINANLETIRSNMRFPGMSVLSEELRNLAWEINDLANPQVRQRPFVIPEIASPLKSANSADYFFRFSIGGVPFVESVMSVSRVYYARKAEIESGVFRLRGYEIPLIDLSQRFGLQYDSANPEMRTVMLILRLYDEAGNFPLRSLDPSQNYAVLIDDLDLGSIFLSRYGYGYAVPPNSGGVFADYARECWDAVGGDQFVFLDWRKLIEG